MSRFPSTIELIVGMGVLAILLGDSPVSARDVDFTREVQPILAKNCQGCHGSTKQKGGLRLDSRKGALVVGDRFRGLDLRLTDVAGNVVKQLLA